MKKVPKYLRYILISLLIAGLSFVISYINVLDSFDLRITDRFYSQLRGTNKDVIIISIDEETLNEYGAFSVWSRDKVADTINYLYSDPDNEPLAIGIDILFQGETTKEKDDKLVQACTGSNKNIVSTDIIRFKPSVLNSTYEYDPYNITMVEEAYSPLCDITIGGFTNAFLGGDGANRISTYTYEFDGKKYDSFAYSLAKIYASKKNFSIPELKQDSRGFFRFFYAGKQKEFAHVPMMRVLNDKNPIPLSEFKDKVVLIGAYASAMQDEYYPTSDMAGTMYGVEINANIFQAIIDGATAVNFDNLYYSLIFAIVVFVICLICHLSNFTVSIILPILSFIVHGILGKYLSLRGILIPQLYSTIVFITLVIYFIARRVIIEMNRRKHITSIFNRYMDPKLVNRLVKDDSNKINLKGEKRYVSVLFVDIRGFTTMSESMDPEDVVGVLNEYLGHVTDCIFKHHGMLDKFIGDAAMAIFNAPVDQDDYIYESVATAYDIAKGSEEISKKLLAKYGKTVSYGVGVHCGEAVIGNIGCKTRMDYTGIGDTVNTSSRIEGKAGKGEILISKVVKEKLEGRIIVEDAGAIELKGKTEPVSVYRLIGLVDKKD